MRLRARASVARVKLESPLVTGPTSVGTSGSPVYRARTSRNFDLLFAGCVSAVYVVIGLVAFWPVLPGTTARMSAPAADPIQTAWFFGWAINALGHVHNLFFSDAILFPSGANLAQATSMPLLGILGAPITLLFGPLATANLLMVLAMPVSAFAGFFVLRKWQVWGPAAALGGLIYGFSPYMVGHGIVHLNLVFVPLPPFIALTLTSVLQGRGSPRRLGAVLGILIAAQFFICQEVLASVAIAAALALLYTAISHPAGPAAVVRALLVPSAIALALAGALVAYPVWMMLAGPQHYVGAAWGTRNPYYNDLLSFVVPGPFQRVSLGMRALGVFLMGNSDPAESGGYIGVPLLLAAATLAWRSRRSSRMQLAVLVFGGAAILSLGPYLVIDGHLTHVPLPSLILTKLPLLDSALPARFSYEVDACLAAVLAFGLDDLRLARSGVRSPARTVGVQPGVAAAVVALALVFTQLPQWPYPTQPAPTLPVAVRQAIPPGDPITITYPYSGRDMAFALAWQAEDDFGFRLLGGYAAHPGPNGHMSPWPNPMSPPGLQEFLSAETPPSPYGRPPSGGTGLIAVTRSVLERYGVRLVLVDRQEVNSAPVVQLFTKALGPPQRSVRNFVVWASRGRPL